MDEDKSNVPVQPEVAKPEGVISPSGEPPKAVVGSSKKNFKKPLLIFLILALVLAGGAYAYMKFVKDDAANSETNNTSTNQEQDNVSPYGVAQHTVYAQMNDQKAEIYWQKIGESEATLAKTFDVGISDIGVHHTKVFAQVDNDIWYSADEGKTYEKVYDGLEAKGEDVFGEQITTAIFDNTGEQIIVATITPDNDYVVKEIVPEDKQVKTLFEADKPLILQGYTLTTGKVFYLKAECWNCDGGNTNEVYTYDVETKKETSWKNPTDELNNMTMHPDLTNALIVTGKQSTEGLGHSKPFNLFDLAINDSKTSSLESNVSSEIRTGYTRTNSGTEKGVYAIGGKLFTVGTESPTYETSSDIRDIFFVGEDEVVVGVASGNEGKMKTVRFVKSTQETTTLIAESKNAYLVGVTFELQ